MTGTVGDRVKETSTTTGTGDFTLLGAPALFQSINDAIGNGPWFQYAIVNPGGVDWETGMGYLAGTSTLVRAVVRASSNGNALCSFAVGTKEVFCTLLASQVVTRGQTLAGARNAALP